MDAMHAHTPCTQMPMCAMRLIGCHPPVPPIKSSCCLARPDFVTHPLMQVHTWQQQHPRRPRRLHVLRPAA
jgi:hypothetical protein